MAEASVLGEVVHGIPVGNEDVEVRKGPQRRAEGNGAKPGQAAAQYRFAHGGTEGRLGEGIHLRSYLPRSGE